jgi:hypothetical protein
MPQTFSVALILIGLLLCPATARAQGEGGGPDPTTIRVRMGPLWMNPSIGISHLGIDQNVFNDAPDRQPKQDFTMTVTPKTDLWLRMGRSWLSASIDEEIVWFQKYSSERSANTRYLLGWRLPSAWVNLNLSTSYIKARERPGYEIDVRAPRRELTYMAAVEGRIMSKTFFGVRGERQKVDFDAAAVFRNANLHDELNHVTTSGALTLRHQITSLTSIELSATQSEDRFELSPLRNSASTAFGTVFLFDPFALIKGTAAFGFRNFRPESPDVPEYAGATMALDLSYTLLGMTRLAIRGERDIQYSYEVAQPYYVQTGIDGSIAQQIFGPFDAVLRFIEQRLAYRDRVGAAVEVANRTDAIHSIGVGIGYHLGKELRLGFNVDKVRRDSDVAALPYDGLKYGTSLTYGF